MPSNAHEIPEGPETRLILRLRGGDPEALGEIMGTHWGPLVGFAGRILSGRGDPQDLVQNVFIRLWARRESLRVEGSFKALLFTMVRNASLDELRSSARRDRAEVDMPTGAQPLTPYQDVQGAELQRAAAAAVRDLPAKRQEVFRLVREEGLTYQEVAEVLKLAPQTVANHMSLALADLRVALTPFLSDAPVERPQSPESGLKGIDTP